MMNHESESHEKAFALERSKIKAVVFDIGQTLVDYAAPLNWSALYRPAFEHAAGKSGLRLSEDEYEHVAAVLSKYNTRIHPRDTEVSSDQIFTEILEGTGIPKEYMAAVKHDFYDFFCRESRVYPDAEETLAELVSEHVVIGTLSDVAYGMDNQFALGDIKSLMKYIDFPYTSNDTGYRKPSGKGLEVLSEKMGIPTGEMAFVGDEKKDMECAANAGVKAILINRDDERKEFGQDYEIRSLKEITGLIR